MHGLQFQKSKDFGAANFVMDFQMDLIDIDGPNVLIKKGPNSDKLDQHDKNNIASCLMELWADTNPNHLLKPNTIKKFLCFGCCTYVILLICMIGVLESNKIFKNEEIKQIVAIALGLISVIVLAIILFGMLFVMQQRLVINEKWRDLYIHNLSQFIIQLKHQFPNLTFSIIYPMKIYSHRIKTNPAINNDEKIKLNKRYDYDIDVNNNKLTNDVRKGRGNEYISSIWCYVRVSEGSIVTSDNEPIYESTNPAMRRKDSEYSKVTTVTSAYSLQIEDEIVANSISKKNHVQNKSKFATKFPVIAKARYSQLT